MMEGRVANRSAMDEPRTPSNTGTADDRDAARQRARLGARVRTVREQLSWTQEQLASRVGRKKNWLSDIERGRRGIDPHTLQRIADLTGHSVEYFTNPQYTERRRELLTRPATREDWELLYAGDPERAAAHASIDEAFNRARRLIDGEPSAQD